jgi:hypothetical protein
MEQPLLRATVFFTRPPTPDKMGNLITTGGYDKPQEAVAYILGQFGIEMGAQHFSSIKTAMKNGTTPTKETPQTTASVKESNQAPVSNGEAGLLESLETLKSLIAQYGADKVKRLVDLLG